MADDSGALRKQMETTGYGTDLQRKTERLYSNNVYYTICIHLIGNPLHAPDSPVNCVPNTDVPLHWIPHTQENLEICKALE